MLDKIVHFMKQFIIAFLLIVFIGSAVQAQDKYIQHRVAPSETITKIAQKYKVTPFDIYRLNPDSRSGIKENDIILVPTTSGVTSSVKAPTAKVDVVKSAVRTHLVQSKETLFSIARDYDVTVDDLRKANGALLDDGLKTGQTITIPSATSTVTTTTVTPSQPVSKVNTLPVNTTLQTITHTVVAGQTLFSIAQQYDIAVSELERLNPSVVQNLPIGHQMIIKKGAEAQKPKPVVFEIPTTTTVETQSLSKLLKKQYANYEVKPKETLYGLAQMFNISQAELLALNPMLRDGVQVGMILKVPGIGSMVIEPRKEFKDLTKSLSTFDKKELVLLLPFNASKIQNDSVSSVASRLKNDSFLNMTLDFYSGALMAIDSAKVLGLNINVRIYDSEENRNSSNVVNVVKKYNLATADAVIGPFYQQHVEKVAALLIKDSIPVISPLSKETGVPYKNVYQAMPSNEHTKSKLLNYMLEKRGNVVMINDPKKQSNRDFITRKYPQVRFVELTENGGLIADNLRKMLVLDRPNYIVLDSERTGTILSTTNVLLNEMGTYKIQLAILEPNETLNFEEISMKRLTILKMLYPSLIRENSTRVASQFENNYKKKNNVYPSNYATRGFDITFDTMLRLSQEKGFAASAKDDKTEHIESKFNYLMSNGEFINQGIYILQYDEDLTVKEAE